MVSYVGNCSDGPRINRVAGSLSAQTVCVLYYGFNLLHKKKHGLYCKCVSHLSQKFCTNHRCLLANFWKESYTHANDALQMGVSFGPNMLASKQGSSSISAQIFNCDEVTTEMCRHANLSPGPQVHLQLSALC